MCECRWARNEDTQEIRRTRRCGRDEQDGSAGDGRASGPKVAGRAPAPEFMQDHHLSKRVQTLQTTFNAMIGAIYLHFYTTRSYLNAVIGLGEEERSWAEDAAGVMGDEEGTGAGFATTELNEKRLFPDALSRRAFCTRSKGVPRCEELVPVTITVVRELFYKAGNRNCVPIKQPSPFYVLVLHTRGLRLHLQPS
ncbi:hypothetical protein PENSPDRAFT_698638 [Peniophora sp. CONT]|nr:hypothetical protein PENSPDRAFT_698638 [Peniophora sp. CONT]